jgi:hypothetical protein
MGDATFNLELNHFIFHFKFNKREKDNCFAKSNCLIEIFFRINLLKCMYWLTQTIHNYHLSKTSIFI